jgi:hypothetical protein
MWVFYYWIGDNPSFCLALVATTLVVRTVKNLMPPRGS